MKYKLTFNRSVTPASQNEVEALDRLLDTGQFETVIRRGKTLLFSHPQSFILYNVLGKANAMLGLFPEAESCFRNALLIKPDFDKAHNNLANVLNELGRKDEAVRSYRRALEINPEDFNANNNLAIVLEGLGRSGEAVASYRRALVIRPGHGAARAQMLHQLAHMCEWDAIGREAASIPDLGVSGDWIPPFTMLSLEDSPERHRLRSENCALHRFGAGIDPFASGFPRPSAEARRLRIGYFSAEIRDHPVARLIARVLELHDRSRFEIHVYSYGPVVEDETRSRIMRASDGFHEVAALSDLDIAGLARDTGIDIAVDLTGLTANTRTGLFAHRPAPVQMSYLGYPGTSGTSFIDYIIADRTLIPEDHRRFFSEAPICLPHCYQAQDDQAPVADRPPSRSTLGLPEQGFVFCAINNSYKIRPDLYDIWMRLLGQIDGSVLWLLKSSPWAEKNLRNEAAARGVDPARIIFADWKPYPDYLAQFGCADLFLDSFIYNAGATASNALWAGLPVLTRRGSGYTARMAASLLNAIGLPELITTSDEAYEHLALELATDPGRLAAIRARLLENRGTMPLFDSRLFTLHIEEGYRLAYRRWLNGEPPAAIDVPAAV